MDGRKRDVIQDLRIATNDPVAQEGRAQVERKRRIQEHSIDHVSKTKPETLKLANQQITAVLTAL